VKVFWSLEDQLAFERHFPAISWLTSYSLYHDGLRDYFRNSVAEDSELLRTEAMELLQKEAELKELVRLVGIDSLSPQDRIVLETTKSIREDFLHQSAFDAEDAYTRLAKQYRMLKTILDLHYACIKAIEKRCPLRKLIELPIREAIAKMRYVREEDLDRFDEIRNEIEEQLTACLQESRTGEE